MNFYLLVTEELCLGCGNCVAVCPVNSLHFYDGKIKTLQCHDGAAVTTDLSSCNGCGLCLRVCPSRALSMVVRQSPVGTVNFEIRGVPQSRTL